MVHVVVVVVVSRIGRKIGTVLLQIDLILKAFDEVVDSCAQMLRLRLQFHVVLVRLAISALVELGGILTSNENLLVQAELRIGLDPIPIGIAILVNALQQRLVVFDCPLTFP